MKKETKKWWKRKIHTQYKHGYVAGNLTHAQQEKEHCKDRPGWREGHSAAEDAQHGVGPEQYRLPAKPEIQI